MKFYERVCAEINLDALAHNIKEIRKNIGKNTKMMAVVKADAYGHGAVKVAETACECGAELLGVAILEEAIELRKKIKDVPIVIVGASLRPRISDVIDYDCQQTVFTIETAREISKIAKAMRKTAKIQIKLDTGMGRLGFLPGDKTTDELVEILNMENISVEGIFSHFACSDHKDKSYTLMQNERFVSQIEKLKERGVKIPPIHISNSAGVVDFRDYDYDIVRPGLILYGLYPSDDVNTGLMDLQPVMSLKASISHVKTIMPGEHVGYNSIFKAERETVVATIPLGYADGYSRRWNNGRVLVGGQFAPIIGCICMDQFMIDVTDIKDVSVGSAVVLIGKQGDNEISVNEITKRDSTIAQVVLCGISSRVPRVYIKDGAYLTDY